MWYGIYLSVRLTSWQKLNEQNPILWKQYLSLYDKDVLLFLKQVEFLDPIHSIHFLTFKISWWNIPAFSHVGMPHHIEVFLDFFFDPCRSRKYYLTPQHHADIVVWMIQYYYPLPKGIFMRRFQCEGRRTPLAGLLSDQSGGELRNQTLAMPIDIYLSHASRCAEQLIEIIRSYNPDTFPLMALSRVRGNVVQYCSYLIHLKVFIHWERYVPNGLEFARKIQGKGQERDSTIPVGASRYYPLFIRFWSSYPSHYRITARCTNNGWPSDAKTENSDLPSLINLEQSPICFMWFATSSSLRFIASFNGYSSLSRIPVVGSTPDRISITSSVQSWRVGFMGFLAANVVPFRILIAGAHHRLT